MQRRTLLLGAWLTLFGLSVLGILPWAQVKFPIVDLGDIVYQVRRIQLGYVPYLDTFNHHFNGYVLPFYLIASVAPLTPAVLKVVTVCLNFSTAILVFLILREIADSWIGWIGAFLTVTVGWFWGWQGFALNAQSYLVPLLSLMLLLVVRVFTRRSRVAFYGAAVLGGLLLISDQRAAAMLALLLLPPLFMREARQTRTLAGAALSFAIVPVLWGCSVWATGAWADFVEQTILFPLQYRNYGLDGRSTGASLAWLLAWFGGERVPVILMIVGLVGVLWRDERRWLKAVFVVSAMSATVYSMAGGRSYPNYFLVFAPIALPLISLTVYYARLLSPSAGVAVGTVVIVLGLSASLRSVAMSGARSPFTRESDATVDIAAQYLREHTQAEDPVLVWGYAPQIYTLGDRFRTFKDAGLLSVAGANFSSTSPEKQGRIPHMVREFDQFLTQTPPKVIVFYMVTKDPIGSCYGKGEIQRNFDFRQAPNLIGLRDTIADSYRVDLTVDGLCDRAEIFVRR